MKWWRLNTIILKMSHLTCPMFIQSNVQVFCTPSIISGKLDDWPSIIFVGNLENAQIMPMKSEDSMAENISENDEVKRRLILFLRIPTEVWTDVLKIISRRNLVQNIAPACYRLKEICDKNVKNIHMITTADQFTARLDKDGTNANQQLEKLAGNNCNLASQFKLIKVRISEKSQSILRCCPDLFNGCQITLRFKEEDKNSTLFLECLSQLEEAKPIVITVFQVDQFIDYWHHSTFMNCSRIDFYFHPSFSTSAAIMMKAFENISDWLHHQPSGVDSDGASDQQIRCMIVWNSSPNHIDWLLGQCTQNIQQSHGPIDRRPYVLSFQSWLWTGLVLFHRIENKPTGEVLVLDRVMDENGEPTSWYHLRRCLAEEEASGPEFYAGMFKRYYGFDEFNIGDKTPKVTIG